jgi:hypothetical protein
MTFKWIVSKETVTKIVSKETVTKKKTYPWKSQDTEVKHVVYQTDGTTYWKIAEFFDWDNWQWLGHPEVSSRVNAERFIKKLEDLQNIERTT